MKINLSKEFIQKLPKSDLHLHLDGSMRISTLIELAKQSHVQLPSMTEEGLRETVFKERYGSLDEYLQGFGYLCSVMQNREQLERVAYELAIDNQREGVCYIEVRFAPQLHSHTSFDVIEVIRAVSRGLDRAKQEFNAHPEVVQQQRPPFDYGIIACAMRYFNEHFSSFHRTFLGLHQYMEPIRIYALASMVLVQAAVRAKRDYGLPIVGFDLAGHERGYPPHHHRETYEYAHRHFLNKTVHAGEGYGPESIFKAITELHADRIGHGTSLFDPNAIQDVEIRDRAGYVGELAQYISDRRITVEVCLTSNQQTNPAYRDLKKHPFGRMMQHKLSATLCTDNRTVSNTTMTDEIHKAVTTFDLGLDDLKNILVYGFKRSFFPDVYSRKRVYVRACMEYFERLVKQHQNEYNQNKDMM